MNSSLVTSQTWLQNFRPYVNGVKVRWPDLYLNLVAGECVDLTLEFEYSYLIGDPESPLKLCCEPDAESLGLACDPPFGQLVEMAEGLIELTWHICAERESSGPFELHFEMPLYQGMPQSPPIPGTIINYEQEFDVLFDSFPVTFGASTAFPCHGAQHTLTVRSKPSRQFLNTHAYLLIVGINPDMAFEPSLSDSQLVTQEGATWTLNCLNTSRNGEFDLKLVPQKTSLASLPLRISLAHNLVTAEHFGGPVEGFPDYPRKLVGIRAISSFLNTPASDVEVILVKGNDTSRPRTDAKGEHQINVEADVYVRYSIINKYDGSTA